MRGPATLDVSTYLTFASGRGVFSAAMGNQGEESHKLDESGSCLVRNPPRPTSCGRRDTIGA